MAEAGGTDMTTLLASRIRLREAVVKTMDEIQTTAALPTCTDLSVMDSLLTELENLLEQFTKEHNRIADSLDAEEVDTKALHADADDLEKLATASYQVGADWVARLDSGKRVTDSHGDAVFTSEVLTGEDTDPASTDSVQDPTKSKDTAKGMDKRKDHRGRSDSNKGSGKALEELKTLINSRNYEYDRVHQECRHKETELQYLEQQRARERQDFLEQITRLEKELSIIKHSHTEPSVSTPYLHGAAKSVSWPEDISSVTHAGPDRERARAAGAKLKSVCKPVNVNVPPSNVPSSIPHTYVHDDMSDSVYVSPGLSNVSAGFTNAQPSNGSVSGGVYKRRSMQLNETGDQGDVSLLAGLVHRNNELMQSHYQDTKSHQEAHLDHQQIPKTKLKTFSGDPLDYWMFLKTYDDLVEHSSMRPAKKLNILITHCSDSVQKLLHGCQLMSAEEGYQKARSLLRAKFGNPFLITQAWKNRLAGYQRVNTPELVEEYSEDLSCCYNTLDEMGHVSELENSDFLSSVSSRLDNGLRAKWRKVHRAALKENGSGRFKQLVSLVATAAEEVNDPVYNNTRLDQLLDTYSAAPLKLRGDRNSVTVTAKSDKRKSTSHGSSYLIDGASSDVEESQEFELQLQVMMSEVGNKNCQCCGGSHFTSDCPEFKALSPQDRLEVARRKRLCILCLNHGHFIGACPQKWTCKSPGCVYRHHNLLHGSFPLSQSRDRSRGTKKWSPSSSQNCMEVSSSCQGDDKTEVNVCLNMIDSDMSADMFKTITLKHAVLPIAPIIASCGSKETLIYGLLDPGSTATVCTERLVSLLNLKSKGNASLTINTMSGRSTSEGQIYDITVQGTQMDESWPVFDMVSLSSLPISSSHIAAASDLKEHKHLSQLSMPQVEVQHVDILIGQDNAHLLKPRYTIDGKKLRDPYAVVTPLGCTIYGLKPQEPSVTNKTVTLNCATIMMMDAEPTLEEQVARSWQLDKVPEANRMTLENQAVLRLWDANLQIVDGYIQLPIPLKSSKHNFHDNRHAVLACLNSLGRRLLKNRELHKKYTAAMSLNFDKGYAVRCVNPPTPGFSCYLTQLPVEHKRKPGVVRPVWNGGFKYKGVSLNDLVYQGPDMTNKITTVMMNFRLFEVAMMGDIKQMYNQVRVPKEQQDLLRFLYWEDGDPQKEVIDCRLTYQMFGGGWSPSICTYALQKIVDLAGLDPTGELALTILKAFYVDDCLKSVVDVCTGVRIFTGVISTLGAYHFDFTKIVSNRAELTDNFPEERRAPRAVDLDFEGGRVCVQHSLGQRWLPDDDVFIFVACFIANPATRREMLSTLSSLYDPLGLCTPFLIPAKRLLQELSRRGLSWDEALPDDVLQQWARWVHDASRISELRIPRWVGLNAVDQEFWLSHFCDASEVAYGTVCYVCTVSSGVILSAHLLTSRAKLAPLKSQSIPRLELCAALLASQLDESVRKFIEVQPTASLFWSDSTLVLRYLNSEPSCFKTFVSNRVAAIQEVTQANQWRHIPGELNPADMLSRGITVDEIISNRLWLHGPEFLLRHPDSWPEQPEFVSAEFPENELKRERTIYTAVVDVHQKRLEKATVNNAVACPPKGIVESYWTASSCWVDLIEKLASLLRFADVWRQRSASQTCNRGFSVTVDDRRNAAHLVIKVAQDLYLREKERTSKTFVRLFPRLRDGMLCIGGRLERSTFPTEFKQPFVLPANNRPASLFIMHCHNQIFHGGVERTLMEVRKTAWLLTGRKGVSSVLKTCFVCKKYKSKPMTQVMADLPPFRLRSGERPFSYIGIDFMGPLSVKSGRSLVKRWVCVIVCSVTRALHLEVAVDLSTSGFLNAFNRFVARRGKPVRVLSDNGTNFVGAKSELDKETLFWNKEVTAKNMVDRGIIWSYNPPAASHFGGMWERHIRTIRSLMLCEARGHTMSDDSLSTLLCLVEQCLNSRPLTRMSDDPEDLSPLTPNHILVGEKVDSIKGVFFNGDSLRRTWKQAQYLADCFWRRWAQQYVVELQKRTKWLEERENLTKGSLVLMVQDNFPRNCWPLGLITKVHTGHDGHVRAADLRTADGTFTRPIAKLVLLEADLDVG